MKTSRRTFSKFLLAAPFVGSSAARAEDKFPSRVITLVAPYGTGGIADLVARVLAQAMSPILGVSVIVENRPGANGLIGAQKVRQAEPDGYTLLQGAWSGQVALPILASHLVKDPTQDLTMVSFVMAYDMMIATAKATGIKTIQELVTKMRDPAARVLYSSFGGATPTDLTSVMLIKASGGKAVGVGYKSADQVWFDAQQNTLTFVSDALPSIIRQVDSGVAVPLLSMSKQRLKRFPDVPTAHEAVPDCPDLDWSAWGGVFAPAKTPSSVLETLNDAVRKAMKTAEVQERLKFFALSDLTGATARESQSRWEEQLATWKPVLTSLDVTVPL